VGEWNIKTPIEQMKIKVIERTRLYAY
jgi:hypothetical protein